LFLVHRFLSPWWRRRQVPPKRRFLQEPHGVTTQKTPFFEILYDCILRYSEIWRHAILRKIADVSEERVTSIVNLENITSLTLCHTSWRHLQEGGNLQVVSTQRLLTSLLQCDTASCRRKSRLWLQKCFTAKAENLTCALENKFAHCNELRNHCQMGMKKTACKTLCEVSTDVCAWHKRSEWRKDWMSLCTNCYRFM
jgi:hypothetical protein